MTLHVTPNRHFLREIIIVFLHIEAKVKMLVQCSVLSFMFTGHLNSVLTNTVIGAVSMFEKSHKHCSDMYLPNPSSTVSISRSGALLSNAVDVMLRTPLFTVNEITHTHTHTHTYIYIYI